MNNGKEDALLEVRSPGGELLFTIALKGIDLSPQKERHTASEPTNGAGKSASAKQDDRRAAAPMTDAQKRYLFRILAEQGIEGDDATVHLKKLLQVEALKQATKQEASRVIEQLFERSKGGKGNGSSVKQSN